MGLLTAALVAGAAFTGMQVVEAKKARKSAERDARRQDTQARNEARKSDILPDAGANIELGVTSGTAEKTLAEQQRTTAAPRRVRSTAPLIGGSSVGGLL